MCVVVVVVSRCWLFVNSVFVVVVLVVCVWK